MQQQCTQKCPAKRWRYHQINRKKSGINEQKWQQRHQVKLPAIDDKMVSRRKKS